MTFIKDIFEDVQPILKGVTFVNSTIFYLT